MAMRSLQSSSCIIKLWGFPTWYTCCLFALCSGDSQQVTCRAFNNPKWRWRAICSTSLRCYSSCVCTIQYLPCGAAHVTPGIRSPCESRINCPTYVCIRDAYPHTISWHVCPFKRALVCATCRWSCAAQTALLRGSD